MSLKWNAVYRDGREFRECDIKYEDIDRQQLKYFTITKDGEPFLTIELEEGRQLVFRKRKYLFGTGQLKAILVCGWVKKIDDSVIKSLCYIYPSGRITMGGANDSVVLRSYET